MNVTEQYNFPIVLFVIHVALFSSGWAFFGPSACRGGGGGTKFGAVCFNVKRVNNV